MITTQRLRLIAATIRLLEADLSGGDALQAEIGVAVPPDWPPELYDEQAMRYSIHQLQLSPAERGWSFYYFATNNRLGAPALVGAGGYKGSPGPDGTVEIGYSILSRNRRQGYATEAALGLIEHAFRYPKIQRVTAETYPHLTASIGVLERCGMSLVGPGSEPGVVRYEVRREERALS